MDPDISFWISHLFSHSVMSDSLWPHKLQHSRLPHPSLSSGVWSNSCPLSRWCHPTTSSSVATSSSCLQSFHFRVFPNELALHIRWPKYWSFSFSKGPSSEYSGLTSFRIDWFDLLAVQGTLQVEQNLNLGLYGSKVHVLSTSYCCRLQNLSGSRE